MMNLDLIFPEIFLALAIMSLLMIGVFKRNSEKLVYNLIYYYTYVHTISISCKFVFY